jgi:serine/threonine protein kinase
MGSHDETLIEGEDGEQQGGAGPQSPAAARSGFVGDFQLLKKIGAGAMGEVHLARHAVSGDQVALKLITNKHAADEAFIKRFQREAEILIKLDHPNIGRALGYGIDAGRPWLALEYIEGPNLGDVLQERGALFEADVLKLAIQIARGLAYAHTEAGLIHRDIKPANILVKQQRHGERSGQFMLEGDQAKIIDFGLAKSVDAEDQRLTLTGIVMGTPAYMSPEQIRCDPNLGYHTDLYAVGAAMFHMLTGRIPFPGAAPAIIMTGHLTQPIPDPGTLVPSLNQQTRTLVMTAMAKAQKDRFTDYRGLINACEKALKALGTGEGTVRLLRKPLVRGASSPGTPPSGSARPSTPVGEATMDFPAMPSDREVRQKHEPATGRIAKAPAADTPRRPVPASKTTSQIFRAPQILPGGAALEARNPVVQGPGVPAAPAAITGSDALRGVFTDKIEKAKTTARLKKNQLKLEALDLAFRRPAAGVARLTLADQFAGLLPALLIFAALAALIIVYALQPR